MCVDCQIPQSKGRYCQRKKYLVFTEALEIAYAMKAAATHSATLKANPDPMRSSEVHKLHSWLTSNSEFGVDSHRLLFRKQHNAKTTHTSSTCAISVRK